MRLLLTLLIMMFASTVVAEDQPAPPNTPSPQVILQETLDQVVVAVAKNPGEDQAVARRAELRKIISPNFDFAEMAKRALGTHWEGRSEAERSEYTTVFSDLLAKTYLSKIDTVKENMVKVTSERIAFPKALVKTSVTHKGDTFPIDYKLLFSNGSWKVYDVIIENIGLVANYRNEFSGIIRKEDFSGLMQRLREKSAA